MNSSMRRLLLGLSMIAAFGVSAGLAESAGATDISSDATSLEAEPGVAPDEVTAGAVYLDMAGNVMPLDADGSPLTEPDSDATTQQAAVQFGPCTPYSGRDNPHRSSTGVAVSGHGWWGKGDCSNNSARVYNCLYEWYTDNSWRQKDCSAKAVLSPGGGSSDRTTARRSCGSLLVTSWRNHVDVDVIGEWDSGENPMRQADVDCRVY